MFKITRSFFLVACFLWVSCSLFSQNYKSAVGGKLGYGLVGTYKTFLSEKSAVDIFGGITWGGGLAAGAYYEIHKDIESVENLQWYFGAGGSFTTYTYGAFLAGSYYNVGVAGVIGLDYKFEDYPINASIDWAPTFVVADNYNYSGLGLTRFRTGFGALSIRYVLGSGGLNLNSKKK